jgi:prepilin-type processing-associated H-X9-DG protein
MRTGLSRAEWAIGLAACFAVAISVAAAYHRACAEFGEVDCKSNLKMVGLAVLMYASDHGGYLPNASHMPSRQGPSSLVGALRPYGLSHDAFVCTEDRERVFRREGLSYNYGFGRLDTGKSPQLASRPFGEDPATVHLLADFGLDWHPHGRTTLFADGHVKMLPKSEFRDYELREP